MSNKVTLPVEEPRPQDQVKQQEREFGELVFQGPSPRFNPQDGENPKVSCNRCGAVNVEAKTFGYITKDGNFVETHKEFVCIECGAPRFHGK